MSAHRRVGDPPEAQWEHGRDVDQDKVAKWGNKVERWAKFIGLVWPLLIPLWTWYLIEIRDNLKAVPGLVESAKTSARNDSLSFEDRRQLHVAQNVTNRILCFNLDRADRVKYNIDCNDIPLPETR
jgi:hypothetical protein